MSIEINAERAIRSWKTLPRLDRASALARVADWAAKALMVAVVFCVAGVAGLALYASSHAGRVYEGVSVGGIGLGGMSPADAEAALAAGFDRYANEPLTLAAGGQTFHLTPQQAGIRFDPKASAADAMAYGRAGTIWEQSRAWARGLLRAVDLPATVSVAPAQADAAFRRIAPSIVRGPIDARVDMTADGQPKLVPDVPGVAIDLQATMTGLLAQAARLDAVPAPIVTMTQPASVPAAALSPTLGGARAAVDAALVVGDGDASWQVGQADLKRIVAVDPATAKVEVDRRAVESLVNGIARQIDRAPADFGVAVDANGKLAVVEGGDFVKVDVATSVDTIEAALLAGKHTAALTVQRQAPSITEAMAAAAVKQGETLLDTPIAVSWPGGSDKLDRGDLLKALTIRTQPGRQDPIVFGLDRTVVGNRLDAIAQTYDIPVQDAQFRIIDGKFAIASKEQAGRALDIPSGVDGVLAAFGQAKPSVTLRSVTLPPKWTAADLSKITLGEDILGEAGTYYGDSSEARRNNVNRASTLETGWLIPPGGVYSYADHVRPVDESNGFVTGFGIVQDGGGFTTAPVVGGGICQVSTTIFQAAFWAGLPIVERVQHPYYLRVYGEAVNGLPGLDAMVNIEPDWTLDFKFQNTTGHWLAVIVQADGENVWARMVGTNPGWTVDVTDPVITNRVSPGTDMRYEDSPELPAGQSMVVETAQDGFDVSIDRTVYDKSGKVIDTYRVASSFAPAYNVTLRGTG